MSTVDLISLATQPVRPFKSIPLIDVSGLSGDSDSKARVASAIREACMHVGFFYVKNHGVDEATIASVVAASHRFFDLPQEEKMKLDKGRNFPGYSRVTSSEGTIVRESFSVGTGTETCPDAHDPVHKQNTWPSENALPGFEEPVLRLHYEITQFALKLTSAFALALNLPEDIFDDKIQALVLGMRLMHYPPQTGIKEHADCSFFTILWQDENRSLQVKNTAGEWIDAVPIPGTFVINIADQLSRMTNGIFKSTVHRVIEGRVGHRYCIPSFFSIDWDARLEVLPSCVSESRPARYEPILVRDYMRIWWQKKHPVAKWLEIPPNH